MVAAIAAQFRQARLELEYITPGEVVEGFENEKLLEMLVSRIRVLNQKVKEADDKIDQYHEQEVSLRQQLSTRVDALQDVQNDLSLAKTVIGELKQEVSDKDLSNKRLQTALKSYRDEVRGLEKLVERMDQEKRQAEEKLKGNVQETEDKLQTELLRHDTTRADAEGKNILIAELERRLNAALQAQEEVQRQMDALDAEKDTTIQQLERSGAEREKAHGNALALRDARVSELREEIGRLNDALKVAYSNSLTLGSENRRLKGEVEEVKMSGQIMLQDVHAQMDKMRAQIGRFLQTGAETGSAELSTQGPDGEGRDRAGEGSTESQPVVRRGRYFDASLARRRSSKMKRRYDSGLDFLEEEGDGDTNMEAAEA
jgi:chromosome segregation ATPase